MKTTPNNMKGSFYVILNVDLILNTHMCMCAHTHIYNIHGSIWLNN